MSGIQPVLYSSTAYVDFSGSSIAAAYTSSNSPFSNDSRKMSRPPMSSPLTMICGNAGESSARRKGTGTSATHSANR